MGYPKGSLGNLVAGSSSASENPVGDADAEGSMEAANCSVHGSVEKRPVGTSAYLTGLRFRPVAEM